MCARAIYLTFPLLDETIRFYLVHKRFPMFYDLIAAHGELIFANDLFFFSLCDSKETRPAALLFYTQYLLPTRQRLDTFQKGSWLSPITELDPHQYTNILQIGGRVFERWAHVYYPKPFYKLCREIKADPFTYTRDYYFRTHEFLRFKRMFYPSEMAYYHDMRVMFTLNFDFYALAPRKFYNKVFQGIKDFYACGKLEEGEIRPDIEIITPSKFIERNVDEYSEFQDRRYDPTLYMRYDLVPVIERFPKFAFHYKRLPNGVLTDYAMPSKNHPFPVKKPNHREELAYFYPATRFFNHMQWEKFATKTSDRYAIQKMNPGLPLVFVLTPEIYLNFMEYWAIDRNSVPPIVHLLCTNNYLKFAVFSELLKTQLPQDGHLNFYKHLKPLYIGPVGNSKAPPEPYGLTKKEFQYLSMRWGVNEAIRRYEVFCKQTAKDKQWHFGGIIVGNAAVDVGQMKDGMYASYEIKTLQQALRYTLDVFRLQYDPVKYDVSTWAFAERPRGIKEAVLYTLDRDIHPVFKGVKSYKAFRKKFGIKNKYWYGDRGIYQDALLIAQSETIKVESEPEPILEIEETYEKSKREYEAYISEIEAEEKERERLEAEQKRIIKEVYHGDTQAFEYAKFNEYNQERMKLRLEKICRPFWVKIMGPITTFVSEEYGQLEGKLRIITEQVKMLPAPYVQMPSTEYAVAAVIIARLVSDLSERKIKRYFKDLCYHEGESTSGFGTMFEWYSRECADEIGRIKQAVELPSIEDSGAVLMNKPQTYILLKTSDGENMDPQHPDYDIYQSIKNILSTNLLIMNSSNDKIMLNQN